MSDGVGQVDESARRRRKLARALRKERLIRQPWSFAYGRRNVLTKLLEHRHGGPCRTDDAVLWLELVLPFIVEATILSGRVTYDAVQTWALDWVPEYAEQIGAVALNGMVTAAAAARSEAPVDQYGRSLWLPRMPELVGKLRITRQEQVGLALRGFACIDPFTPEEKKERNRDRMRATRFAAGVVPQSKRTKTKDLDNLAAEIGVKRRVLYNWLALDKDNPGTFAQKVAERRACTNVCPPLFSPEHGTHGSVHVANDDHPRPVGDNDDMEEAAEPISSALETGFVGRHFRLTAGQLRARLDAYPNLRPDIDRHLAEIDQAMRRVLPGCEARVLRNHFRDRNRIAGRLKSARKAA